MRTCPGLDPQVLDDVDAALSSDLEVALDDVPQIAIRHKFVERFVAQRLSFLQALVQSVSAPLDSGELRFHTPLHVLRCEIGLNCR